jgi:pyruvate formate lyase activating enzyme
MDRRKFIQAAGGCALGCGLLGGISRAEDFLPSNINLETDSANLDEEKFIKKARHWVALDHLRVECQLCPRRCQVADQERGYCGVRENRGGDYYTLVHGRACTWHADPIEKKPLFHVLPGEKAFSIATAGCNIECKFCQNWNISQFRPEQIRSLDLPPEKVVTGCRETGSKCLAFTYSEPVIFYEYMFDSAVRAEEAGVHPVMISNGYIEPEPMKELLPHLTAVKIDLKAFTEKFYKETCSGRLKPVLNTLELLQESGKWFELVVLIVPTLNDDPKEIRQMCKFVATKLSPDVPLHFSRYHPTYKIQNIPPTPTQTLERCHQIAREEGLRYVYLGNLPGHPAANTQCPSCEKVVIRRYGFLIRENKIKEGKCSYCGQSIPGVWG